MLLVSQYQDSLSFSEITSLAFGESPKGPIVPVKAVELNLIRDSFQTQL